MNKSELIDSISAYADLTKTDASKALDAFMAIIENELSKGDDVTLVGFGAFSVVDIAERKGRNPQTGEELIIPAKRKPVFKAGKSLKLSANGR